MRPPVCRPNRLPLPSDNDQQRIVSLMWLLINLQSMPLK